MRLFARNNWKKLCAVLVIYLVGRFATADDSPYVDPYSGEVMTAEDIQNFDPTYESELGYDPYSQTAWTDQDDNETLSEYGGTLEYAVQMFLDEFFDTIWWWLEEQYYEPDET